MLCTSFLVKKPTFYPSQNSWPLRPRSILKQNLNIFFQLLFGPLNMQSTSFRAKTPILYSGQISWQVLGAFLN